MSDTGNGNRDNRGLGRRSMLLAGSSAVAAGALSAPQALAQNTSLRA